MITTSSSRARASRGAIVLVGLAFVGVVLAACSSSTSPTTGTTTTTTTSAANSATTNASGAAANALSKLQGLSSTIQAAEKKPFKAVYTITSANAATQTVTVEQSPPKSAFGTKSGDVIDTGTASYYCTTTSTPPTCLSAGTTNPLASLVAVFSPETVLAGLREAETEADAHAAGYNVSFSSGTYAGQGATCANLSGLTGTDSTVKYCVTNGGVLAYVSATGGTFSLTSYSSSPPASDFALPAGATVETIPGGVPS
jgi:hypothetical protein